MAQPANAKGEVVVKVADRRYTVNQKRLSPHLKKEQFYPDAENYDLSIVLDTLENRKAKNKMRKRHVEGAVVTNPARRRSGSDQPLRKRAAGRILEENEKDGGGFCHEAQSGSAFPDPGDHLH